MTHDVFVSYSSKDRTIADAIVMNFEANGVRCWYAPRDIAPGGDWGEAITQAIEGCSLFVLIFSGNANASKHVLDELYYAIDEEKIVLPFRVENIEPKGAMRLHLSSLHWLDAYKPAWETHIDHLYETAAANLARDVPAERTHFKPLSKSQAQGKRTFGLAGFVAVLFPVVAAVVAFAGPWRQDILALAGLGMPTTAAVEPTSTPTVEATATAATTPTPESDYLGSETNPIRWMFMPLADMGYEQLSSNLDAISAAFSEFSDGLRLTFIPAADSSSLVEALCDGEAHIASLMPFPYLAASARNCAAPEFVWVVNDLLSWSSMIVTHADSGLETLEDLAGTTYCVPGLNSQSGWLIPSLELRAAGIDPENDQINIVTAEGHAGVIVGVYRGDCDAGSTYYDAREVVTLPDVMDQVVVLHQTVGVPHVNISFGSAMDLTTAQVMRQFLASLAEDEGRRTLLAEVLGHTGEEFAIMEINDYYFEPLRGLLEDVGMTADEVMALIGP